ncbi:MAG: AsmA family, partial [Pseudomonadota bacterium]
MTGHARRAVAAVALLALAALAASAAAWRTAATLTAQRGEFLASVSRLVGWPIEAGSIDVAWFPPALVARDVSVPDESPYGPGTLAYAEEARFKLSLGELLRGRIVVDDVRLQAPVLRAVRGADGGWNLRRRRPGTTSPGLEL